MRIYKKFNLSKEILEEDYKNLGSLSAVAKKYNISITPIRSCFKRHNISYNTTNKIYSCNDSIFSVENEISFYLAGFIAADGYITKNGKRLTICLSKKDISHLEKIKSLLNSTNPIHVYKTKHSKYNSKWKDIEVACLSITSKQICDDLNFYFEIKNNKSLTYKFPLKLIHHKLVNHFMRGYFDGDGSFYNFKSNNLRSCLRGTTEFLEIYKNILNTNLNLSGGKIGFDTGIGRLDYYTNQENKYIYNFLYKNSSHYLYRKFEKGKLAEDYLNSPLVQSDIQYKVNNVANDINIGDEFFFNKDSEESLYWIGYLYKNIKIHNLLSRKYITIYDYDRNVLEKFLKVFPYLAEINNKNIIKIYSKNMISNLETYFSITDRMFNGIPDWLFNTLNFKHFLRGYIDNNSIFYIDTRPRLRLEILGSQNTLLNIKKYFSNILISKVIPLPYKNNKYSISYTGKNANTIYKFLYDDCFYFSEKNKNIYTVFNRDRVGLPIEKNYEA